MLANNFFSFYFIEIFVFSCFLKFISLAFGNITSFWYIYSLGVLNMYFTFFASKSIICNDYIQKVEHYDANKTTDTVFSFKCLC